MTANAFADASIAVGVSSPSVAQGEPLLVVAHVETDAGFGGGHVDFKYQPADQQCAAQPAADGGSDAGGGQAAPLAAGAQSADVGGQQLELAAGTWRICGWVVDDAAASAVAVGSATVTVTRVKASLSVSVKKVRRTYEVVIRYDTSSLERLFATVRRAGRGCPATARGARRDRIKLVRPAGRTIAGAGGVGRALTRKHLRRGRWTVCAWIQDDALSGTAVAGPVARTFSVTWPRGVNAVAPLAGRAH